VKWRKISEKSLFKNKFVHFRQDICEMPSGKLVPAYYVLDMRDWVNIVAVTKEKKIILVEQYRHAFGEIMLEIPGGSTDANESPRDAAIRELLEETGFQGNVILEKSHVPNPALQSNRMWTYLVTDCEYKMAPSWDEYEVLKVHQCSFAELSQLINSGKINHSLILASLFLIWNDLKTQIDKML
jgi:8-oxo-dGTP pyrophosphatase MutT (NUDIX family)